MYLSGKSRTELKINKKGYKLERKPEEKKNACYANTRDFEKKNNI